MKKILCLLSILFVSIVMLVSCAGNTSYDIVATNFPGYDAAMSVLYGNVRGTDNGRVKMLLKPGFDIHSYEPSATDIRSVLNCKVFIYVGGESDSEWVESDILGNVKAKDIKIISMFEVLKDRLILEDGEEDEYDEHVWLDPSNFKMVINAIKDAMIEIDSENKETYINNVESVFKNIDTVDYNTKYGIDENNIKEIVVADRNPFAYFAKYYGIKITGALNGCSSDKNVPLKKIIELKNCVEENRFFSIYKIELSDGAIAKSVYNEVLNDVDNGKYKTAPPTTRTLYSMQNISLEDFNDGMTYSRFMSSNSNAINNVYKIDIS
ncbi:MAG: zinc ABC transporter substrate-binding protein [Acholeplasmatales bacterium]|nr:zinc ABC transporter substrate-binding protein [Acholeplasmatales bacterium]